MKTKLEDITMPALAIRGLVIFPNVVVHFDVTRETSEAALRAAMNDNKLIFITSQRDDCFDEPDINDLYQVGVVAEIRQMLKGTDNVLRVLAEGKYRAKLIDILQYEPYLVANVREFPEIKRIGSDEIEIEAVMRAIKQAFYQYATVMPRMPKELTSSVMKETDPFKLFDVLVFNIPLAVDDKEMLLEESHIISRLGMLLAMISREVEVIDIERNIQEKVRQQLDNTQKEYYLRAQMKAIANQLGESEEDEYQEDYDEYSEKIQALDIDEESKEKLFREVDRLNKMSSASQDAFVIRNYLDNVLELPWNISTKDKTDVKKVKEVLDKDHYGLDKVKERILENIAVRELKPDIKGQIICLVGPPGVGKTSIGKSIARAMGRKYQRISLGGVRDESDIRGHRKTYVGAMPRQKRASG